MKNIKIQKNKNNTLKEGIFDKFKKKKTSKDNNKDIVFSKDDVEQMFDELKPNNLLKFIEKEQGVKKSDFVIQNLGNIALSVFKMAGEGAVKIGKNISSGFKTDREDEVTKNIKNIKIDEKSSEFSCMFDGEDGTKIIKIIDNLRKEVKDVPKETEKVVNNMKDKLEASEVSGYDNKKIEDNFGAISSALDNNKGKKGDALKKEIETNIENEKQLKDINENIRKKSLSLGNMFVSVITKSRNILKKDYKTSMYGGIYDKDEFIKESELKNSEYKTLLNDIKSQTIVAIRLDYFGEEESNLLGEEYKTEKITDKNKILFEISNKVEKILKETFKDELTSYIKFRTFWNNEENDNGNLDSLFLIGGLSSFDDLLKQLEEVKENSGISDKKINTKESLINGSVGKMLNEGILASLANYGLNLIGKEGGLETTVSELERAKVYRVSTINDMITRIRPKYQSKWETVHSETSFDAEDSDVVSNVGWIIFGVKAAKMLYKYNKEISDMIGSSFIKFKNGKGVIAKMNFYLDDTKYSLRFSTDGYKWNCYNTDDVHKKVDEQSIKVILNDDVVKKFKKYCLEKWTKIFRPDGFEKQVGNPLMDYVLSNKELKIDTKHKKALINIQQNFDKIENLFK